MLRTLLTSIARRSFAGASTQRLAVARMAPAIHSRRCPSSGAASSRSRQTTVMARAERSSRSESFTSGFILGGVIFGALGFLFAPQISKALLGDDQRLKLPRFLEEEKDPEQTKQDLIDKIAQLNASIDEVAGKLKVPEGASNGSPVAEAMKLKT